jgi:hypothetical protein
VNAAVTKENSKAPKEVTFKRYGTSVSKPPALETGETVVDDTERIAPVLQLRKVIPSKSGMNAEVARSGKKVGSGMRNSQEPGRGTTSHGNRRLSIGTASKTKEAWMPNPRSSCMLTPQSQVSGLETSKKKDIFDRYFESSTLEGWNIEG